MSSASPVGKTLPNQQKSSTRIAIPGSALCEAAVVITPKSSDSAAPHAAPRVSCREKIGRWSEEEHQVFLKGLEQHGKQWKLIAGMIGTRTVVQVRTHAQKYFQRMERGSHGATKRQSLPPAMPSRKSKKPKKSKPRATSLSLGTTSHSGSSVSPTPDLHHTFPSFVSNASSMSSESSWSSTFSPSGVTETLDPFETLGYVGAVPDLKVPTMPSSGPEAIPEATNPDGQDPLEWLIDAADTSILPESSLPVFQDLSTDGESLEPPPYEPQVSTQCESALDAMADPAVTVQSLFLLPDNSD